MKLLTKISIIVTLAFLSLTAVSAQKKPAPGGNAALRYWSAFAQMQDAALTDQQVQELNGILDGPVPYDDSKFKDLVERNKPAIETMIRATTLPVCEWGVDYQLGPDAPVDYVRKALALGRLNVLYAFHLAIAHDNEGATQTLAAGIRFSHDVAAGGTLFATAAAKNLLVLHIRGVEFLLNDKGRSPSAAQQAAIRKAIAGLGPDGLDWQSAMKRELEIPLGLDAGGSIALARIVPAYLAVLRDPANLPKLQELRKTAPAPLPDAIPNPERVLQEKQDLISRLQEIRARLQ
jgi:hypothetical protein